MACARLDHYHLNYCYAEIVKLDSLKDINDMMRVECDACATSNLI